MASSRNTRNIHDFTKQFVSERRVWWHTDLGNKCLKKQHLGLDFTVMSYNILSQILLDRHKFLYRDCNSEHLQWNYRFRNLLQEIIEHDVDIICLQEVQEDHYIETILPRLVKCGYLGLYKKKTMNNCDGCAILYKKSVFRLDSQCAVEYHNPHIRILDRDNVGLIAVFQPIDHKYQEMKLCVATTHLLFNPKRGDVKLAQLRILLAELEKRSFKFVPNVGTIYYPVILCGDLNSEPFSPLYNFISRGSIKFDNMLSGNVSGQFSSFNKGIILTENALNLTAVGIDQDTCYQEPLSPNDSSSENFFKQTSVKQSGSSTDKAYGTSPHYPRFYIASDDSHMPPIKTIGNYSHPFSFNSAYRHFRNDGKREVTNLNVDRNCTVDYIFYGIRYSHNVQRSGRRFYHPKQDRGIKHLGSYGLLYLSDVKKMPKLPNSYLSSDHICLIAKFLLKL